MYKLTSIPFFFFWREWLNGRGMLSKSAEKCQHLLQTVFAGIWQSPGKSVRVNDLDDCSRGGCHLVRRSSSRGTGGRWWGYGEEICLNLAVHNLARCYTTNDIILPWKESWKFAVGSQLPTGGCHALWLEKYFFHWQILSPDPLFFFFLQ